MKMFHMSKWNCINKWLMMTTTFMICIFMVPGAVMAELPWLDFSGSFTYDYSHFENGTNCITWSGGKPADRVCLEYEQIEVFDYNLSFTNWNITGGQYIAGPGTQFGEGDDPITNAVIEINGTSNTLLNDASPNNLDFGSATFTIKDGSTTFLSATLDNFIVDDGIFFGSPYTELNKSQDDNNITNVTYGTSTGSQYITDLSATTAPFNLAWAFTFNGGTTTYGDGSAFTEDNFGTFQGKMYAGPAAVVPEPISSVLFLSGAATLGIRRFRKKRK